MAPGSGPARWNPQSQQWEHPVDPRRRSRRRIPEPTAGGEAGREPGSEAAPAPGSEQPAPGRPDLPPKPAHPPGNRPPPDPWRAPDGPEPRDAPSAQGAARRWRLRLGIAVGVAVAVGGAALGATYLTGDRTGGRTDVPDGYTVLRSAGAGFRVAVPDDWQLSTSESGTAAGTVFRPGQGRGSLLQVYRVTGGSGDPCAVLVEDSKELSSRDGYRRISLGAKGTTGCEIVYEIPDGETNGTAHCVGRLTVASDGSRWVLLGVGPAAEARAVRTRMAAALGSFRPD
ncbi:hypothetical protein EDE04_2749 [Streptomyces sp. 2132.2]|uniref:hypothetical protein n=1 Tax=Streptomyces sp. 2132.2 TaxID=2485161 RepID=UPI000F9E28E8|nr:hypothetical protein [Streptomyces sp. 2132.2]ROQ96290.1 hypothetical protein EDE04_2749 [Streptomyces sp. 2132.2]